MTRSRTGDGMEISPTYTVRDWRNLKLDPDAPDENQWEQAANILKDRIEGRFLKPAQALIDMAEDDPCLRFGFAILALDFLVIETVQGFRKGCVNHDGESKALFKRFLVLWSAFQKCVPDQAERDTKAERLYKSGRCALHHSGSTDRLIVRRTGDQMLEFGPDGRIELNRTVFHQELSDEFARYIDELKNPASVELRANLKAKMDAICRG